MLQGLWDCTDTFYYDCLHVSSQETVSLRIRSLVGLMPLIAVHVLCWSKLRHLPRLASQLTKSVDASMQQHVSLHMLLINRHSLLLTSSHSYNCDYDE